MANVIKLRKGLDINLKGAAAQELVSVKEPGFYSLVPDDYTGITPKVVVKEQEYVMAGGPLWRSKKKMTAPRLDSCLSTRIILN